MSTQNPGDRSAPSGESPAKTTSLARDRIGIPVALLAPMAVTLAVVPFRDDVANTNAALVLVLVIVGVAAVSTRRAGILAALSAAVWFDVLLTEPYGRVTIDDQSDIETAVLLLLVGLGVTQLAVWGRRQHARAEREAGYLDGIRVAAEAVSSGSSPGDLVQTVARQLTTVLGLRSCTFQYGVAGIGRPARLLDDGSIVWDGATWDVEERGLPLDTDIELLVESRGELQGRFMLTAAPASRPSKPARLVATTLAAQVGAALR
jgi:K+-sensing histidine kinase KdpD